MPGWNARYTLTNAGNAGKNKGKHNDSHSHHLRPRDSSGPRSWVPSRQEDREPLMRVYVGDVIAVLFWLSIPAVATWRWYTDPKR